MINGKQIKQSSASIIAAVKYVSRKDAKTAKKTGGGAWRPLREMVQTTINA